MNLCFLKDVVSYNCNGVCIQIEYIMHDDDDDDDDDDNDDDDVKNQQWWWYKV